MNSILLPSSLTPCLSSRRISPNNHQLRWQCTFTGSVRRHVHFISLCHSFSSRSCYSSHSHQSSIAATIPSDEGPASLVDIEDSIEKDWSFLDMDDLTKEENKEKIGRIISAGGIKKISRVLVSIGSEDFVDQLADTSPCGLLLVVHDSLFLLACIKEKYDKVKCWQGELIHLPEKWAPLDVVFLFFLPALPFRLDQVFEALSKYCSKGARVVISHPQGREVLEQQRKQYQDVIVSELPDKMTLQKVAADNSFEITEYVDEPGFFLAVLQFSAARN